jgi:Ca2+-binding EF-hand superfamily protein
MCGVVVTSQRTVAMATTTSKTHVNGNASDDDVSTHSNHPCRRGNSTRHLTNAQIDDFREAFDLFDKDRDGRITCQELFTVMQNIRQPATDIEIREMITHADKDGNGTVEFDEFLSMMARRLTVQDPEDDEAARRRHEAEMRQAFQVFDIDGDGLIDASELRQTMANLGERLTDDDVRAMIKEADKNGDGKVDYEEFVHMIYSK